MPIEDLVLANANVLTMNPRQPRAEAVAVKGERILLVGRREEVRGSTGAGTRLIDCQGKTLVPGFHDAHCHLFSLIRKFLSLDLSPPAVASIGDIQSVIRRKAQSTPAGEWMVGTGYNEFYLAEKRHPTRRDIDAISPHHPVLLVHRSLHACVLNSLALKLAGITSETGEPPGSLIDRDTTGEPSGLLYEMLSYVKQKALPPYSEEDMDRGLGLASAYYLSLGITSLQEATVSNDVSIWQTLRRFKERGRLASRVTMLMGGDFWHQFRQAGLAPGSGDGGLRLGAAKLMLREARGELYPSQAELNEQVLALHRAGFPAAIHAVSERAVAAAATALEEAQRASPEVKLRHRIEHCSECPPHLLERLRQLKTVIASQPPFIYFSGDRYLATIPAGQLPWLYRFKSFLDEGLVVAGSSDSPVVSANPLIGIYAAVTRRTQAGQLLETGECISPLQALAMYTVNAAYASGEEDLQGSIAPGKLADMVLLSQDPTQVAPEEIKDIKVEITVIGGEII